MEKRTRLATCIMLAGFTCSPAVAQKVEIPDLKVDVYGFINLAVMHADTGNGSEQYIVDNDYASSRVGGFVTTALEGTDTEVGAHIEYEFQHNPSNKVTPQNRTIRGDFEERHLNLFADGAFGRISVGQGHGAADDSTEMDLSGTKVASFPDLALVGGALPFVDRSGNGENPTLFQSIRSQDFEARYDRLRYDTPALGHARIAVSQGYKNQQDITEVAAVFNHTVDGLGQLSGAIGYSSKEENENGVNDLDTLGGSISWRHRSGFNLTGVYSNGESDAGRDSDFTMIKPGYRQGRHSFTVHRAEGKDFNPEVVINKDPVTTVTISGSEVKIHGMAYVYRPVQRLEVFAAHNNFSLESQVGEYDDISITMIGSRFHF